jgi:hypothetical protein
MAVQVFCPAAAAVGGAHWRGAPLGRSAVVQAAGHGGARGADAAIDQAASRLGWPVQILRAQWSLYGRGAGPVRNRQMLQRACQLATAGPSPGQQSAGLLVIAFPGGPGTASLLHQAHRLQGRSPLPIELIDLAAA